MNILIVSMFPIERNTSVAISSISILEGLLGLGHQVTMIMPSWPKTETSFNLNRINVVRIAGEPQGPPKNLFQTKIRNHFGFLDTTRSYLNEVQNTPIPKDYYDVVISFSDPKTSHIFTYKLIERGLRYGKWIQHWGDPLYGDITKNFWWPQCVIRFFEKQIINKADKVVYVTPFTLKDQQLAYPSLKGIMSFVPLPAEEKTPLKPIPNSEGFQISYMGDYNNSIRNLTPLYKACSSMNDVFLTIAGHGSGLEPLTNIKILPRISQQMVTEIEADTDVIVCVCNLRGSQIPGKAMYKASTDKHVLIVLEKSNRDLFEEYFKSFGRFTICDNTVESITSAITSLKTKAKEYSTPERLVPTNVVKEILA